MASPPNASPAPGTTAPQPRGYATKTLRFLSNSAKLASSKTELGSLWSSSTSDLGLRDEASHEDIDVSNILYPTLQTHPAPLIHPILVMSLASLSSVPAARTHDELFNLLLRRLEPWVGEEGEGGYVLIVLAADGDGAPGRRRMPGYAWWAWKWRQIPRKFKKNLKRLYIIHPSLLTRTLLPAILPFVSPKAFSKLHTVPSLLSPDRRFQVPLKGVDITLEALQEEAKIAKGRTDGRWNIGAFTALAGTAASYLALPSGVQPDVKVDEKPRRGYWGNSAYDLIIESGGKVPTVISQLGDVILAECSTTEGMFRRTSSSPLLPPLISFLDLPLDSQPNLPWAHIAKDDPLLAPKLLLRILGELQTPLMQPSQYSTIRSISNMADLRSQFLPSLSKGERLLLSHIIGMLHDLSLHESSTKMSPLALAIVLAPTLIRGPDPLEDASLCLEPGKKLPEAMIGSDKFNELDGNTVVGVLEMWIRLGNV